MPGSIRGPAEEKGAMFRQKNRRPRQEGKPKPQPRADQKYFVAKEHGKESKKGRTKFSSGESRVQKGRLARDSEGKELTGESVSEGEEGRR